MRILRWKKLGLQRISRHHFLSPADGIELYMTGGSQGGVSAAWWEVYTPTKVALSLDYTHKPWYSNKFSCYEFRGRRSAFETLIDIRDALEDPERLHPGLRHIIETQRNRS